MNYRIADSAGNDYFVEGVKTPYQAIKAAIEEGQDYTGHILDVYEEHECGQFSVENGSPVIKKV